MNIKNSTNLHKLFFSSQKQAGKKIEKQLKDLEKKLESETKKFEREHKKATELDTQLKDVTKVKKKNGL